MFDLEGEGKIQKRSKLHSRLASWSAKGRQVVGVTVLRSDGTLAVGNLAFEALKDHWGPIFNGGEGDSKAREELKDCVVRCPEGLCPLSWEKFLAVCAVRRQFAPGPDGISYLAWNSCGEEAAKVLYECYLGIVWGGFPLGLIALPLCLFPRVMGSSMGSVCRRCLMGLGLWP